MVLNIVHISDLQAGGACLAEVETPELESVNIEDRYLHYARVLSQDVKRCLEMISTPQVHLLALTGDVANTASTEEYGRATIFISELVHQLDLPWRNVAIVPGNHDVDWRALKQEFGDTPPRTAEEQAVAAGLVDKMANFGSWLNDLYGTHRVRYHYDPFTPILFSDVTTRELTVIGLDSCESQTHNHRANHGAVGYRQLTKARELFENSGEDQLKIALLHHNPFTHEGQDSPSGLNTPTGVVRALTESGVKLVLAGHMHRPQHRADMRGEASRQRPYHVLVAGPCCMRHEQRQLRLGEYAEVLPNRYQIVSVDLSSLFAVIWLRRFSFERWSTAGAIGDWTNDADPEYTNSQGMLGLDLDPDMERTKKAWKAIFRDLPPGFPELFDDQPMNRADG